MEDIYHARIFLNDEGHGGLASVLIKMQYSQGKDFLWGQMTISDCYKKIELDFNAEDMEDLQRSIRKIRRLKDVCAHFEAFLEGQEAVLAEMLTSVKKKPNKGKR